MMDLTQLKDIMVRSFYTKEIIVEIDNKYYKHNFDTQETEAFDYEGLFKQGIFPMPCNVKFKSYNNILNYRKASQDWINGTGGEEEIIEGHKVRSLKIDRYTGY